MKIQHKHLKVWVEKMAALCGPDKIVWCTGSDAEKAALEKKAVQEGDLIPLHPKKLPGCFYHRSDPHDVARAEHLTFLCTPTKNEAGPTNNWMAPDHAYQKARDFFHGSMKGRTMYVIPFVMGRLNSPFAKMGVQLTDSLYVVLNMRIMTTMGSRVLKKLSRHGEFTKCLHSRADLNIKHRLILHFPQDNTIWSVGSGYGGNALLGKKCLALRIASALGAKEGWMAEHMVIMGIQDPSGSVSYIAAAFPSACGKTNLAMMIPPDFYQEKGYKIWTIGDDIAWLRIGEDGHLYAVNPEAGMFGVVPGTNSKTNPNALAAMQKNTIFTNVLLKDDRTVWWEGCDEPAPAHGTNWKGEEWGTKILSKDRTAGAHPNSRFTTPLEQCPTFSKNHDDPKGVKLSAILFGGRHSYLSPLVYEAHHWQHGVFVGATVSSETTAAQMGLRGAVRRDPMAMIPFCGLNMGDYFHHWLEMGKKMRNPPRIFHVNWFRKDAAGQYIWPGFGDNFRVLEWILNRCRYQIAARQTPYGNVPFKKDVNLNGLDLSNEDWENLFSISSEAWEKEIESQKEFFLKFGSQLPKEILDEQSALINRLELKRPLHPKWHIKKAG